MEFIIMILLAVLMIESVYLLKITKEKKEQKIKYEEHDRLLTEYVAANLDMEKQLRDTQHDFEKQQDMAEEIKKIQEQSRLLKHDMKNHTLVMLSYLEEDQIEETKKYASDILDKLNKMYTYVNVGNSLLNYIINNKLSKAKEMGIEIKAEIENLAFSYIDSVDFSALLNNILDNAIEGAMDSKDKKLEVQIFNKKGFDSIVIKNTIDVSVLENNPDFISTKEEQGHGFGMKQIEKITEKYEGILDIYEKGRMFVVGIMFLELRHL